MNQVCTIDVAVACPGWIEACPALENLVREAAELALAVGMRALKLQQEGPLELGITLGDAAAQRRLNRNYRGVDRSTNVLAFPAWQPEAPSSPGLPILLGDVVLAWQTVASEARQQSKPLSDHLNHLVVHGVLHLIGFDHAAEAEALMMEALERSILAELGVPDPYRDTVSLLEPAAPPS
jgi:probable rRNA maturation factor